MLAAPAAKREAKVGETGRTLKAEPRRASSFDPAPAGNQAMLRMFAAQRGLQAKPAIDRPGGWTARTAARPTRSGPRCRSGDGRIGGRVRRRIDDGFGPRSGAADVGWGG